MLDRLLEQLLEWMRFGVILTSNFQNPVFLLDPVSINSVPNRELLLRTGGSGLDTVVLYPKLRVDVEWRVSPRLDMRLRHVIEMTIVWFLVYTKFIILTCVQCNGRK